MAAWRAIFGCGHDTVYALDRDIEADDRLLAIAAVEDRRLITRDRALARRADDAVLLEAHEHREQLRALRAVGITLELAPGPPPGTGGERTDADGDGGADDGRARCGRCNGRLVHADAEVNPNRDTDVDPDATETETDPSTRPAYVPDEARVVWRCMACGRYFWRGSHWERVAETLASL